MAREGQIYGHEQPWQQSTPDLGLPAQTGRRWRGPTVLEALPFTPLTSIVPFNPDTIPPPLALPSFTYSRSVQNADERRNSKKILEELSTGAANAETASKKCVQTLQDVQKLLEPDNLTQFTFKAYTPRNKNSTPASTTVSGVSKLSPFAKLVFDKSEVSYQFLTPESIKGDHILEHQTNQRGGPDRNQTIPQSTSQQGKLAPHIPVMKQPVVAEQQNGSHMPLSSSQHNQHKISAVVIPASLTPMQRAQFEVVENADIGNPLAKRDTTQVSSRHTISIDQRRKMDMATGNLESLLQDIFEAEDQLQPDTSGGYTARTSFFITREGEDGHQMPILRSGAQAQLETALLKVYNYRCLDRLSVESLERVQRLCENTVTAAESVSLTIAEEWMDSDVEEWRHRINIAEDGLCASRTLLRIMMAGRPEKELQSEDHLRQTLQTLKNIVETCIVPIVEQRASESAKSSRNKADKAGGDTALNQRFVVASNNRDILRNLLWVCGRSLRLLGDFLIKTDVDEASQSIVEYLCKALIFAENASSEKDSVLGTAGFEDLRKSAMDVYAGIFMRYPDQRHFILQEILVSLEKLPPTKQSARQYRLVDAKPIQLVSALLMRLVQTSACRQPPKSSAGNEGRDDGDDDGTGDDSSEDSESDYSDEAGRVSNNASSKKRAAKSTDLETIAKPLHDAAQSHASYIIKVMLERALTTSKSSEEPHRKLLDIFVEDFLNVLGSADWPAAQMLLFTMLSHMVNLVENNRTPVPSKTMALEVLGTMGSGILELRMTTKKASRSIDTVESELSARLASVAEKLESDQFDEVSVTAFDGPYRILLEYLQARGTDDAQLQSAYGCILIQWAREMYAGHVSSNKLERVEANASITSPDSEIRNLLLDPLWLERNSNLTAITTAQGKLAALIVAMQSRFCKAFNRILQVLLNSMSSEQSRIKSRGLKSVVALLEQDPSVLDRGQNILGHIYRCATDSSPLVRDSALDLIAKCINMRPALDKVVYEKVIARAHDTAIGVRKRAMKLLKDIYLNNTSSVMRTSIAQAILSRMNDTEESVRELARTIVEEIWFLPLHATKIGNEQSVETKLQYRSQAAYLIRTVSASEAVATVLESLINDILTKSKVASANMRVCEALVGVMFDGIIDEADIPGSPSQAAILQTLAVFARTSPRLFTASQLERLQPYTQNLTKSDDLDLFSSVVIILRHVIPHIGTLRPDFLEKIQLALQASVTKLAKSELAEVAPCLWTVTSLRKNFERPMTLTLSVLTNLDALSKENLNDGQKSNKAIRLIHIAGQFGRACDFTEQVKTFKTRLPRQKADTVPGLVVEILCSFASPKQPLAVRTASIENVCVVSQAWPKQFLRADVINSFETVFKDRTPSLEHVLLEGLAGFLCALEVPSSEDIGAIPPDGGIQTGAERIGRTYVATDSDGASTSLAQRFHPQILRLALSSVDELALTATRLITTIARQGMTHPKENCPALVALETSPNHDISRLAFLQHRDLNHRFETMFDKEYMRAIQQAFTYQQQVVRNTNGFSGEPSVAKMQFLWEILKLGKAQIRKKFLKNVCDKLSFDMTTLEVNTVQPQHLLFTEFCAGNLALFDYDRTDEVLLVVASLEKVFASVGTSVAQAIENDVLRLNVESIVGSQQFSNDDPESSNSVFAQQALVSPADPERLRLLAVSAQILTIVYETRSFIYKLWGLQKQAAKVKKPTKDQEINKAPTRVANAASLTEAYIARIHVIMASAASPDTQQQTCRIFAELMSTDHEVKVASDDDDDNVGTANGFASLNGFAGSKSPSLPPDGLYGKKRKGFGGSDKDTPRKKRRPSAGRRSESIKLDEDDDDDADGEWV